MHVEDQPLDYFEFEGVIPREEYGGASIVWDWGHGSSPGSRCARGVAAGSLHFDLWVEVGGPFVWYQRPGPETVSSGCSCTSTTTGRE